MSVSGDGAGPVGVSAALSADQLAMLLETNTSAFIRLDRDWTFTYVNKQAELLLQRPRERLLGRNLWTEFPNGVGSEFEVQYRRALESGEEVAFEESFAPIGGWFEVRATPDADGLSVFFLDVTARRRAYDSLVLVAEITRTMVGNRDVDAVASTLATSVVPTLATWAMVSLYSEDGRLYEAAACHRDGMDDELRRLEALHPQLISDMDIVAVAAASGVPQVRTGLSGFVTAAARDGGEMFQVLERLGCESIVLLPLRARERAFGILALLHGPEGGSFSDDEVATAVAVADRAGLALENAHLYSRQRIAAETLQRSLLTPLPQPDHLHLVARYLPAADGTEVGGDWYDAFLQPDGATVLVIGDIVGHDMAAAAAMGQLRNLLRGTAYDSGDGPRLLLLRLDALIAGLGVNTLATVLVGRLEQSPEQATRSERTFRWSNAGHAPPMVRKASGAVEILEAAEPDVLLGLDVAAVRREHTATLQAGDTLLLYTDGLVERRERSLTVGIAELADTLARLEMTPLDQACDELLRQLLVAKPFDDVALLAVHTYPSDQPRPAAAGPELVPDRHPAHW